MTTMTAQLQVTLCPSYNMVTTNYLAARGDISELMLPELEQHNADTAIANIADSLALEYIGSHSYMVDVSVMPQLLLEVAEYNTRRNGGGIINIEVYTV
jgi:hypothetical protein